MWNNNCFARFIIVPATDKSTTYSLSPLKSNITHTHAQGIIDHGKNASNESVFIKFHVEKVDIDTFTLTKHYYRSRGVLSGFSYGTFF